MFGLIGRYHCYEITRSATTRLSFEKYLERNSHASFFRLYRCRQSLRLPTKPLNASRPRLLCSTAIPFVTYSSFTPSPTLSSLQINSYAANCWKWAMARTHGPSVKRKTRLSSKLGPTTLMPYCPKLCRRICRRVMVRCLALRSSRV